MAVVGQLPTRSHTTFGGCPYKNTFCSKSLSLDTITYPLAAANVHTAGSEADAIPNQRTSADSGYSTARKAGNLGDGFWSKRSLTQLVPPEAAVHDLLRTLNMPGYPRPSGQENRPTVRTLALPRDTQCVLQLSQSRRLVPRTILEKVNHGATPTPPNVLWNRNQR